MKVTAVSNYKKNNANKQKNHLHYSSPINEESCDVFFTARPPKVRNILTDLAVAEKLKLSGLYKTATKKYPSIEKIVAEGKVVFERCKDKKGNIKCFKYGENKKPLLYRGKFTDGVTEIEHRNNEGHLLNNTMIKEDGKVWKTIYRNDGQIEKEIKTLKNGEVYSKTDYFYDESDMLVRTEEDASNGIFRTANYQGEEKLISEEEKINGIYSHKWFYESNEYGPEMLAREEEEIPGLLKIKREYEGYDEVKMEAEYKDLKLVEEYSGENENLSIKHVEYKGRSMDSTYDENQKIIESIIKDGNDDHFYVKYDNEEDIDSVTDALGLSVDEEYIYDWFDRFEKKEKFIYDWLNDFNLEKLVNRRKPKG